MMHHDTERPGTRTYLIVPRTTVFPHEGGGQRTAIIFEALRDFAPTTVIILGPFPQREAESFFPGAESVIVWSDLEVIESATSRVGRAAAFVRKYFFPTAFYRPIPEYARRLAAIDPGSSSCVMVFRLFRTMALADARAKPERQLSVIVDVDDRDDQKADARMRALFGDVVTDTFMERLCIKPLHRLFSSGLHNASRAWFATKEDAAIEGVGGAVIENAPYAMPADGELSPPSAAGDIIFVGPAYHPPNLNGMKWFLKECWPHILQAIPQARLRIVGGGDWREGLNGLDAATGIEFRGFVADIAAEYRASRLAICPLSEGGGSKVKLIEACAFQRPVVATSHSTRGFSDELVANITKVDDAAAFADACVQLMKDGMEADRRGQVLREIQQRIYSRDAIKGKILDELRALPVA